MGNITFAIIKPDAVKNKYTGLIYDAILKAGFKIIGAKLKKCQRLKLMSFMQFILKNHFIMN